MRQLLLAVVTLFCFPVVWTASAQALRDAKFAPDGRPADPDFFPVAVWLQNPDNAARYRAAGINLYVGLWQGPTAEQLKALKAARMPVVCAQNEIAITSKDREVIVGYLHGDEPDNAHKFEEYWQRDVERIKEAWPELYRKLDLKNKPYTAYGPPLPPKWIVRDYQEIKKQDPSRPVLLNLGQGVAWEGWIGRGERTGKLEDYPEYMKGCDIVSFDIYPACHEHPEVAGNLWFVARGVERLVEWSGGKKPVWSCIECTRISHPDGQMATPDQVKAEVWMAIIHGATGLIYFVHEFKPKFNEHALLDHPEMLDGVTATNRQIQELAPVLNSPTLPGLAKVDTGSKDAPVAVMAKKHRNSTYLFAVAMRPVDTSATFTVKGLGNATAKVLGEKRTIPLQGGKFQDQFAPYAVHLYQITK